MSSYSSKLVWASICSALLPEIPHDGRSALAWPGLAHKKSNAMDGTVQLQLIIFICLSLRLSLSCSGKERHACKDSMLRSSSD